MTFLAITLTLLASGGLDPIDDEDRADLGYLRFALTEYVSSCAGRRFHEPEGVMADVHAEHLRMCRESFRAVQERRK